ncbi:platelet-activating factor acetylhydrolase 2, cytoplasmic-like [Leucoraja erinacea]|uniref:platelet-activating factor acetylhydrolase 2, cytoplasmic-like n=1 Tax=Leucoraja erinaceus TaxID=7782 RepID=UPI002458D5D3|nr:platelet-activating factor acetylhydrolase 2, cytoplasmic-like [Leucoraja erinacea]
MGAMFSLKLPTAKGPLHVGCTDFMIDHTREGSFCRLYYPCEAVEQSRQPLWIPRYEYCAGLVNYLNRSRWSVPLLNLAFGYHTVPVAWNAPFRAEEKYPLIIFSHGLGAFRSVYSAICLEIASHGFIVAAVEHRDESAAFTYYYQSAAGDVEQETCEDGTPSAVPISPQVAQPGLKEVWLPVVKLKTDEEEFPLRNDQLRQRVKECSQVLNLLTDINQGKSVNNAFLGNLCPSVLKDCIDLQRVAMMGHSFGGSTSVQVVAEDKRFRCAVALDSWMLPLSEEMYSKDPGLVFFINSEKFQTEDTIRKMGRLQSMNDKIKIITILGSVHQSMTDFTLLTGNLLSLAFETRGTIDPLVGLKIIQKASLAFLQRHLDLPKDFNQWDDLVEGKGVHIVSEPRL